MNSLTQPYTSFSSRNPIGLLLAVSLWIVPMVPMHADDLKLGMIGLDTSHVVAFTRLFNQADHPQHIPGARVTHAFKGGSPDVESSYTRVDRFTEQLQTEFGVKIVPTIEALCREVDAVLLESVDGRPHLEQARPVLQARLPLFIDKPMAGSLRDVIEIFRLAEQYQTPVFTSSSYRYYESMQALKAKDVGEIRSVISYGPCSLEPHHPDLFWYGVHPTEALFTLLGTGCQSVVRTTTEHTDVVTGVWENGVVGTLHGLRNGKTPHRVIVFGSQDVAVQGDGGDYAPLLREVMQFFQTKQPPVSSRETIEMFAFMEAADESKRRGGAPVKIREVLALNGFDAE